MKIKNLAIILVAVLMLTSITACSKNESKPSTKEEETTNTPIVSQDDNITITGDYGEATKVLVSEVSKESTEYKTLSEALKETTIICYDIEITDKNNVSIQPDGTVKVTIKLSEELTKAAGNTYEVYYVKPDTYTKLESTEKDGYITFETDHFSVYAVTKCTKEKETVTTDTETTEPEKPVESETPTEKPTQKPVETTKPTEKPTTTPTETEGPAEGSIFTYTKLNKTMYATNSVNVRSNPTVGGDKLGGLTKGQSVKVTGQCNETDWYRIEFNGGVAYVSNGYLSDTKPVEPTEKPTPKPTEKPSEKPKEEETTKPTKNYDGYDAWGNGFVYNDDMNKVFDCDFPLPLLKPGEYPIIFHGEITMEKGFFYTEEQFATTEFYMAQGKTQEMYDVAAQGMIYIGHYNGVRIDFNGWMPAP